jgi:hypothetical protein
VRQTSGTGLRAETLHFAIVLKMRVQQCQQPAAHAVERRATGACSLNNSFRTAVRPIHFI